MADGIAHEDIAAIRARLNRNRVVNPSTGCWEWNAGRRFREYGGVEWRGRSWLVHRLSAVAYLGFDGDARLFVCHRCDNPPCFNPRHLFIGTAADNSRDCAEKGRARTGGVRGERHGHAKLTDDDVRAIRAHLANGITQRAIADQFGVTQMVISKIKRRVNWAHVSDEVAA